MDGFRVACRVRETLFGADGVDERPQPVDLDLNGVAVTQKPSLRGANACRRAGRDDVVVALQLV